jgi:phage portal protein BeeE
MGILKAATGTRPLAPQMSHNYVGAESFRTRNPYILDCYDEDRYASIYPSVRAIASEFMKIRPFAIGASGEKVEKAPVINALYHPNQLDSSVAFFEKLAVMNLTHRNTYLLVWRREGGKAVPGGALRPNNLAGFTFLENPAVASRDGRTYYSMGAQEFSDMEVITIPGGVDPSGLYQGYAAGVASRRWATLDEYIADFQKGFFENGAVPAGQFVITSASTQDFNDTVDKLQEAHRGAGKNNNVTYTPRPVDPSDGKPSQAKIEWLPFQESNKDIDFKSLFEQANNRIDSTFGVPASIRGVGENNNYATARTDQQNFIRFTIQPLALRIYTQITHELNRITGGLGVAVTFEIELPAIADEEKVQAETKSIEVLALKSLIEAGYSLDTVVDALALPERYKDLELGAVDTGNDDADQADVDEGGEVDDSPNPSKIDGVTPIPRNEATDFDKLFAAARKTMKRQVDKAADEVSDEDITNQVNPDPKQEEENEFVDDMMVVIAGILVAKGDIQYSQGKKMLKAVGVDAELPETFTLPDAADDRYRLYLQKVATSYMTDTADSIRKVLASAKEGGLTLADTKKSLKNIMNTDEYRIRRMAETELNRSQALGSIESMRDIQSRTGVHLQKGLLHGGSDSPCQFCAVLLERWVDVDQDFVLEGEAVMGADGGVYLNNFQANEGYDIHPNGHCSPQYRISANPNNALELEYKEKVTNLEMEIETIKQSSDSTKEELSAKVAELEKYATELEGILDGQG